MKEELEFVEAVVDILAGLADGMFIDLKVRPKSKRKKWTFDSYKKEVLDNIEWWLEADPNDQLRVLNGLKSFTLAALDEQFWGFNTVVRLLQHRHEYDESIADNAKDERRKRLRKEQAGVKEFDVKLRCLECGLFLYMYDEKNNKRHEKKEVCTCKSSKVAQNRMKMKISAYRLALKKRKKKDPKRYQK